MNSMDKIMLKLGYIKKEHYVKERNRFKKLHKENQLLIARINQLEEEKQDLLRGLNASSKQLLEAEQKRIKTQKSIEMAKKFEKSFNSMFRGEN